MLTTQRLLLGACVTLLFLGAAQAAVSATTLSLLQSRAPSALRGRLLGINTLLIMGVRPLGDFPASAAFDLSGIRTTLACAATVVMLVALITSQLPRRQASI